jgi:translocation and assembly module TamA
MWAIHRSIRRPNNVRSTGLLSRTVLVVALSVLARQACAGIEIEIGGVAPVLENNIREFLSLSRYAKRDDLTEETVARLQRRIPGEVQRALEPLGYYAAAATFSSTFDGKNWKVHIEVDPGRAVRVAESSIKILGEGQNDRALAAIVERDDLHPGSRLDHGVYESVKAELLRVASNEGYLDAKLTEHEIVVDVENRRATITLAVETGARYHFGKIDMQQPVLKDSFARRLLRMHEGDPYSLDLLLESQYMLDDSQYFTNVELDPGLPDPETHDVPLTVRAQKNKRNLYAPSIGYGTDTRFRGKLVWDNRYLNQSGHRSQVELIASSVGQEATAKYIIPVMDIALEKFEASVSVKREELGDVLSRRGEIAFGLTQALGSWQRVSFLRFSDEINEGDPSLPERTFLIIPGMSYSTLPPSLLVRNPRRYSLFAELTGSPKTLRSDATFLQLHVQTERVFDLSRLWHLRVRGEMGVTWSDDFDTVPASHRFFAGGDNSIRGFGLNELSPVVNNQRVGGQYLVMGSVEFERDLPKSFAAVVFSDVGNAFDHFTDPLEYSVGIGGRFRIAGVASIGVDVAQALSRSDWSPHLHLRLTTLF